MQSNSITEKQITIKEDASLSVAQVLIFTIGFTFIITLLVCIPFLLIWGWGPLKHGTLNFLRLQILLPIIFISIIIHEALHGLGFVLFGRLSWRVLHFGFKLKALAAYAYSDQPIKATTYRQVVALPGVILGVVPIIFGLAFGIGWITIYGYIMLVSAGGDLAILWQIRKVPSNCLVLDHPGRAGCWILSDKE
jgi:hypothetical protein